MKVNIKNVEGLTFLAKGESNHWLTFDGPESFGGFNGASRPMETLLMSFGACTGSDVKSIVTKMRLPVNKFEIELNSEKAEEHPKVFKWIQIKYKFWGDGLEDQTEKIEKAINLSQEKYCPIAAMLSHSVKIEHRYELNPDSESSN